MEDKMQDPVQDIYRQICNYTYVSFDLFDTLIKRSVSSPEGIFELVELRYNEEHQSNISNFKKKRILAERKARELKTKEDITLDDIYHYVDYEKNICEALMKEEIEIEITTCCPNIPLCKVYQLCAGGGIT